MPIAYVQEFDASDDLDVWASEEQHARFMSDRLMPIIEDLLQGGVRPHESSYTLHDVVTG